MTDCSPHVYFRKCTANWCHAGWKQIPTSCTCNVDSGLGKLCNILHIVQGSQCTGKDLRSSESECSCRAYRDRYVACYSTLCCSTPRNHAYWQIIWLYSVIDYLIDLCHGCISWYESRPVRLQPKNHFPLGPTPFDHVASLLNLIHWDNFFTGF